MTDPIEEMARKAARDVIDWLGIIPRTDHKVDGVANEIARHYRELLDTERDAAIEANHSVRVCANHTSDITDPDLGGCVICDSEEHERQVRELVRAARDAHGVCIAAAQLSQTAGEIEQRLRVALEQFKEVR